MGSLHELGEFLEAFLLRGRQAFLGLGLADEAAGAVAILAGFWFGFHFVFVILLLLPSF
jgi:hypothetical protein